METQPETFEERRRLNIGPDISRKLFVCVCYFLDIAIYNNHPSKDCHIQHNFLFYISTERSDDLQSARTLSSGFGCVVLAMARCNVCPVQGSQILHRILIYITAVHSDHFRSRAAAPFIVISWFLGSDFPRLSDPGFAVDQWIGSFNWLRKQYWPFLDGFRWYPSIPHPDLRTSLTNPQFCLSVKWPTNLPRWEISAEISPIAGALIGLLIFLEDDLREKVQDQSGKVDEIRRGQRPARRIPIPFLTPLLLCSHWYHRTILMRVDKFPRKWWNFLSYNAKICTLPDFQEKSLLVSWESLRWDFRSRIKFSSGTEWPKITRQSISGVQGEIKRVMNNEKPMGRVCAKSLFFSTKCWWWPAIDLSDVLWTRALSYFNRSSKQYILFQSEIILNETRAAFQAIKVKQHGRLVMMISSPGLSLSLNRYWVSRRVRRMSRSVPLSSAVLPYLGLCSVISAGRIFRRFISSLVCCSLDRISATVIRGPNESWNHCQMREWMPSRISLKGWWSSKEEEAREANKKNK